MTARIKQMFPDIGQVWIATLATLAVSKFHLLAMVVSGPDIKLFLECALILTSIVFTIWRMTKKKDDN